MISSPTMTDENGAGCEAEVCSNPLPVPIRSLCAAPGQAASALDLSLLIDSPISTDAFQPIAVGLPFPRGAMPWPTTLTVFDSDGQAVSAQTEPLARWSDGTIRWLLLDFAAQSLRTGTNVWKVVTGHADTEGTAPNPCTVRHDVGLFEIAAGDIAFRQNEGGGILPQVILNGRPVFRSGGTDVVLTGVNGRVHRPRTERVGVESAGPVRFTLCLEGTFPGVSGCRFLARLDAFAGTGLLPSD